MTLSFQSAWLREVQLSRLSQSKISVLSEFWKPNCQQYSHNAATTWICQLPHFLQSVFWAAAVLTRAFKNQTSVSPQFLVKGRIMIRFWSRLSVMLGQRFVRSSAVYEAPSSCTSPSVCVQIWLRSLIASDSVQIELHSLSNSLY